jgi:hypothetical protein
MNFNKKIISLIDNHLHEIYNKQQLLESLNSFPEIIEEHIAYRALIGHDNPLKSGDSFSFSKDGLAFVLDGHKDRFNGEDIPLIIYKARVLGYNLKKIILALKEQGILDDYVSKLSQEDELIALDISEITEVYHDSFWDFFDRTHDL